MPVVLGLCALSKEIDGLFDHLGHDANIGERRNGSKWSSAQGTGAARRAGSRSQQPPVGTEAAPRRHSTARACPHLNRKGYVLTPPPVLTWLLPSFRTCVWLDNSHNQVSWGTNKECRFQGPPLCRCRAAQVIPYTGFVQPGVHLARQKDTNIALNAHPFVVRPPFSSLLSMGLSDCLGSCRKDCTSVSLFVVYSPSWRRGPVFPAVSGSLVPWNPAWWLVGASGEFE